MGRKFKKDNTFNRNDTARLTKKIQQFKKEIAFYKRIIGGLLDSHDFTQSYQSQQLPYAEHYPLKLAVEKEEPEFNIFEQTVELDTEDGIVEVAAVCVDCICMSCERPNCLGCKFQNERCKECGQYLDEDELPNGGNIN